MAEKLMNTLCRRAQYAGSTAAALDAISEIDCHMCPT